MKKLGKIIILVLAVALCLFTPGTPIAVNSLLKLLPTETTYEFTAPTQSTSYFTSEAVGDYDLADWNKPSSNNLVSQQVTNETNASFHETYPDNTLTNAGLNAREPYVIATSVKNMPAHGCYTTSSITLPANGYYVIEVDYCLKEQDNKNVNYQAFGTFYLNDDSITLQNTGWNSAAFYIHTDVLESTTVTPELYFGSRNDDALGAIYFDKFTVTAYSESQFNALIYDESDNLIVNPLHCLDYSKENTDYVEVANFNNTDFDDQTNTNAESKNSISTSYVPTYLGYEQPKFHSKNGATSDVMILRAKDSNASLTLDGYTFEPKPHEVYMFQFYSIATAAADFSGFYFTITPDDEDAEETAEQVATLSSYPYYNGWQLNTIFFIAGQTLNQSYTLGFSLASTGSTTTGWACIDEFKIYKVNGSYATNNATATGVHDTYDMNAENAATLDVANGYFELGTSADTVTIANSGYPYPLVADSWTTTEPDNNGIVNLHATLWNQKFGECPHTIKNYDTNNNVYMMHNTDSTANILTSPALSTTVGETTYISFDAFSDTTTKTKAYIITASTDDEGNLTDIIVLGSPIKIETKGAWQHYEFSIVEDSYAVSRSYYLRFEMNATGYAYIDNVRTASSAGEFTTADESSTVDLTNPLAIQDVWQTTDELVKAEWNATKTGLTATNIGGQKTVLENTFAYNLSADTYYEFVITARGKNAYLGLSGYDGLLEVTTDEVDAEATYEYRLYVQIEDEATTAKFQITLGYVADEDSDKEVAEIANGEIFISNIKVNSIEETEFDEAKTTAADNEDSRMLILSVTEETEETDTDTNNSSSSNSFFGENWWYLIPTLITAIAILLAVATFLFRKIKFEKHITKKSTSYARDMRLKNQQNKIVAQKAAKVDNITDEPKNN